MLSYVSFVNDSRKDGYEQRFGETVPNHIRSNDLLRLAGG